MNKFIILLSIAAVLAAGQQNQPWKNNVRNKMLKDMYMSSETNEQWPNKDMQKQQQSLNFNQGDWRFWREQDNTLTWDAVFGGMHEDSVQFVMRAQHIHNGQNIGTIVGAYDPIKREAYITHDGVKIRKPTFELLLHSRPAWGAMDDKRTKVRGGTRGGICRGVMEDGEAYAIGNLEGDLCKGWFDDKAFSLETYEILVVSCEPISRTTLESSEESENAHGTRTSSGTRWVNWTKANKKIPRDAVFGGYDATGPFFIIQADFNANNLAFTNVPGEFNPTTGVAKVLGPLGYQTVTNFRLLTHGSHRFTPRHFPGRVISSMRDVHFCQTRYNNINYYAGRLDSVGPSFLACQLFNIENIRPDTFNVLREAC